MIYIFHTTALSLQIQNSIFELVVVINVSEFICKPVFARELLNTNLWHLYKLFKLFLENISVSDNTDTGC